MNFFGANSLRRLFSFRHLNEKPNLDQGQDADISAHKVRQKVNLQMSYSGRGGQEPFQKFIVDELRRVFEEIRSARLNVCCYIMASHTRFRRSHEQSAEKVSGIQ